MRQKATGPVAHRRRQSTGRARHSLPSVSSPHPSYAGASSGGAFRMRRIQPCAHGGGQPPRASVAARARGSSSPCASSTPSWPCRPGADCVVSSKRVARQSPHSTRRLELGRNWTDARAWCAWVRDGMWAREWRGERQERPHSVMGGLRQPFAPSRIVMKLMILHKTMVFTWAHGIS